MRKPGAGTERLRSYLVVLATIGTIALNWLAASGRINSTTPQMISERYPTPVTPAGYAFAIWSLIYFGLVAFSVYQLVPSNLQKFRSVRSLYVLSAALNCAWIFFWHSDQIVICLGLIIALGLTLYFINAQLSAPETTADYWLATVPFSIYFGWVTAAALVNFAVMLAYLRVDMSNSVQNALAAVLILIATGLGIFVRIRFRNYFCPLAIAWALTAIAVGQSGKTVIVITAALGVIACLVAAISSVMNMNSRTSEQR